MTTTDPSKVKIVAKEKISAIWLVPIIACLFGAWLIYKNISERGVYITVEFDNASGIVAGKTKVKYKGLDTGLVQSVEISENLQTVLVEIEMVKSSKQVLTENTKFWFVTADVSLQGVKGLDTLLSGSYINVKPDFTKQGAAKRHFIALDEEPPLDEAVDGLHLKLITDKLGSLNKGSPITFKQITVGYISGYKYLTESNEIEIQLFIEPEHAALVRTNTKFWNASGVDISGSLTSGVEVKTESLASIIAGGIAFDIGKHEANAEPAKNGEKYRLYDNFSDAQMSTEITLELEQDSGIDIGAAILFEGITLGKVKSFSHIDPKTRKITAIAEISPRIEKYLTDQTDFFIESPAVNFNGATNLSSVLTGAYIGFRPSTDGKKQTNFQVYNHKPPYRYDVPGLHLVLATNDIESVSVGTGIYYKQQTVGDVQAIENTGPDQFLVHIFIKPQFEHYLTKNSRFWHDSGITLTGGLQKFELKAKSVKTILAGGISFDKGKDDTQSRVNNGDTFDLFQTEHIAKQRVPFTMEVASRRDISVNTRIMYRGEKVGEVHEIKPQGDKILVSLGLLPNAKHLLKEDSQFWLVKPEVTLSGLTDTEALFGGTYIAVNVGEGKPANHFKLNLISPAKHSSTKGLQLSLKTNNGSIVTPGSSISYRGIVVGQVDNVALDDAGKQVSLNITIYQKYRHLVTNYTRFYNASGLTLSGGVGSFTIKTESADAILRGAISFYNPDSSLDAKEAAEESVFNLYDHITHAESAGLAIEIHFDHFSGLKPNTKIKYQDQDIGIVERVSFDDDGYGVSVFAFLNDNGKKFAVEGTTFWLATPELGLVGSTNISGILDGGFINLIPGSGEKKTQFIAAEIPPIVKHLPYGLNIKLTTNELGSVRVGNPVLYRQVKVGNVIGVGLSDTADQVNIYINIATKYASLVNQGSKFWNTSGFSVEAGIFSGVNIESQSMETLLSGGIAFATPELASDEVQAPLKPIFNLYNKPKTEWFNWRPKINIGK